MDGLTLLEDAFLCLVHVGVGEMPAEVAVGLAEELCDVLDAVVAQEGRTRAAEVALSVLPEELAVRELRQCPPERRVCDLVILAAGLAREAVRGHDGVDELVAIGQLLEDEVAQAEQLAGPALIAECREAEILPMVAAIWHLDPEEVEARGADIIPADAGEAVDVVQEARVVVRMDVQIGEIHEGRHDAVHTRASFYGRHACRDDLDAVLLDVDEVDVVVELHEVAHDLVVLFAR